MACILDLLFRITVGFFLSIVHVLTFNRRPTGLRQPQSEEYSFEIFSPNVPIWFFSPQVPHCFCRGPRGRPAPAGPPGGPDSAGPDPPHLPEVGAAGGQGGLRGWVEVHPSGAGAQQRREVRGLFAHNFGSGHWNSWNKNCLSLLLCLPPRPLHERPGTSPLAPPTIAQPWPPVLFPQGKK